MPKLAKFEEWTPPWGKDEDFDLEKGKKLIHGLLGDKETLQERVVAASGERDTAKSELAAKQTELTNLKTKDLPEAEKLQARIVELEKVAATGEKSTVETMKLRAALKAGLDESHVDRLIGTTQEALDADAVKLSESFGGKGKGAEGEEGEEETGGPTRRPAPARNPGDPKPEAAPEADFDKQLASIPRL
jgi:hypothetical protein